MNFRFLIVIYLITGSLCEALAQENCDIHRNPNDPRQSDLIQAATLGEEDRETEEQFADSAHSPLEKVQQAFAATGVLNCGGIELTAQVTGKENVLTTAAHIFFDNDCNRMPQGDVSQCFFRKSGNADEKLYYVDASSLKTGKCIPGSHFEDWATIKMTESVEGIEPYRLPVPSVRPKAGDPILTVSAFATNFNNGDQSSANFNVCTVKKVMPDQLTALMTDCDTGFGASGSAQFKLGPSGISLEPDKLILSAIHVAQSKGYVSGAEFGPDQYNKSVPVSGKFLDAIKANMK